jgi:Phosphoribosyl transferase/TRSP domain C terminus to PRTase_2
MSHTIELRSGTLHLEVEHADIPLEELCGFGSRRSHKRGFLFISKVLGKHTPVRPRLMDAVHTTLAARLSWIERPAVVIAMAETATALGQGVFQRLLDREPREDLLFLHTTRYRLDRPLALTFDEGHSHATTHRLYRPADPAAARLFDEARTLILVDDEISTGQTLVNLARACLALNPYLSQVYFVCLTDWLGTARQASIRRELRTHVLFESLLRGEFQFSPRASFDPGPTPDVTGRGDLKDAFLPRAGGRLGLRRPVELDLRTLLYAQVVQPGERVLVLGTGEFSYLPYRLALHLEYQGHDVSYQSTTRSPILVGEDVASAIEFVDNYHDEMPNYLYNVADKQYDRILIGYETHPLPASHHLPEMLGAQALFLDVSS